MQEYENLKVLVAEIEADLVYSHMPAVIVQTHFSKRFTVGQGQLMPLPIADGHFVAIVSFIVDATFSGSDAPAQGSTGAVQGPSGVFLGTNALVFEILLGEKNSGFI